MFAHTKPGRPTCEWEPLADHLTKVAGTPASAGASGFASVFDAAGMGHVVGLWHDIGKCAPEFQTYLKDSDAGRAGRGGVDHSTAGAVHAMRAAGDCDIMASRALAFVIAGHHAGLADQGPAASEGTLLCRLAGKKPETLSALAAAPRELVDIPFPAVPSWLAAAATSPDRPLGYAMFVRMLFSCLVDADRIASEAFDSSDKAAQRAAPDISMTQLREALDICLAALADPSRTRDTPVNRVRAQLQRACHTKAVRTPGLFSLTAPTGSGKTLSSMAFALRHAEVHGLRRIVYALPFTSVTEQNAKVFRDAFASLGEGLSSRVLLEHHSAFKPREKADYGDENENDIKPEERWRRLAAENWDAPVVVTTNVQLLESLFSNNPSDCRKVHRLAKSVIILDEAQSLPVHLLRPTLAALQELSTAYGTTIVLCSATMPAVVERQGFPIGLKGVTEIVDRPVEMATALRRADIKVIGALDDESLAQRMIDTPRVLTIVNTRKHAARLFESIRTQAEGCFHLSALMCPDHRSMRVEEIKATLKTPSKPCRVVSTQVVEAGIDIDFPVVYRAMAGLDSIIQSAGRCNREGKLARGEVFVFETDEAPPPGLRSGIDATREVLTEDTDPLDLATIEAWFRLVYWQRKGEWDGRIGTDGRSPEITKKLGPAELKFRTVSELYNIIDEWSVSIVVPYSEEGTELCQELLRTHKPERSLFRKAQRFSVSIAPWALARLIEDGKATQCGNAPALLTERSLYDSDVGLRLDGLSDPDRLSI